MNAVNPTLSPAETARSAVNSPLIAVASALDIRRLLNVFLRRLRLFSASAIAVFVAVVLFTIQATPMFTATANVMLDTRKEQVTSTEAVLSGLSADSPVVDTEVEVLKSRQLAERVTAALKLEADPEFNPRLRKPKGLQAVAMGIGGLMGVAKPSEVKLTPFQTQALQEQVVDAVLDNLTIRRSGLTYIINVSFKSSDPQKASIIANKFADLYLLEQLQAKFDATRQANNWLNDRLGELRAQVLQDEAAVQQYKIDNNLMSASGTSLTEQEISNYNQNLALVKAQVAEDNARLSTARSQMAQGSTGEDVGEALSSPVIQQLRQQRAETSRKVADLEGRYGDRHPEMLKAKRELGDIDANIQAEVQRIIKNLEAKSQVSRERANAVAGTLGAARGTLANNNRAMVRLNELERTAEATKTLYESYLNRFKETSTQEGIEQSDARVVSRAKIPTGQSSPNIPLNLAIGLLLALGAGAMVIVLAEMMDAGLATAEDVEKRLDTAYLGAIPLLSSVAGPRPGSPIDHVIEKPLSSFSESLRNLRASIQYARLGEPVQVVAITSALPSEGKTTTSVSLGRAVALQGGKVIVIDCDLRRRSINRALKTEPTVGLLEVLAGTVTLEQAVMVDDASGCHFLSLAKSQFTPKDVFNSVAMDRLLAELRAKFDFVILDTAPVLPVADTRVLAPKADVVVFLTRWRKTPQHAVEAAFRMLAGTGAHVAGVALTQMDMKQQAKYGYGDPGYYYAEYKKYYTN
jgi:capsular exopolysaccharide synthesis family protein